MNNMEIPEAYAKAEQIAKEAGFKLMAFADAATIELRQEVRDMCAANTCGKYGSNWACPPGCGDLDECRARVAPFKWGIIVQTTGQMEDSFDFETVAEIAQEHDENFLKILDPMREAFPGMLALGAGTCNICAKCAYPDKPCRFPDKRVSSVEAYGMVVNEFAVKNGLKYNYGPNTMTYTSCCLLG